MARLLFLFVLTIVSAVGIPTARAQPQPPATTDDVVLLVRSALRIGTGVRQASGHIVVNDPGGNAKINRSFRALAGTQTVADTAAVFGIRRGEGPQFNELFANQFTDSRGASIFLSAGPVAVTLPLFSPFPSPVTVAPGSQDLSLVGPVPVTLSAGDYGTIGLRRLATLFFEGGVYNIKSIRAGGNSRIYFNGPTTLNISDRLRLGRRSILGPPSEAVLNGRCIVINVASDRPVRVGGSSNVTATISAPNAFLRLAGFSEYRGNFVADGIKVGRNSVLEAAPPLPGPCQ